MSSGTFRISVSTVLAFLRRSSSFSVSSAQLVMASNNNELIAHANIFFMFMRPPRTDMVVVTPGRKPQYGSTLAPGDTFTQEFPSPNDSGLHHSLFSIYMKRAIR